MEVWSPIWSPYHGARSRTEFGSISLSIQATNKSLSCRIGFPRIRAVPVAMNLRTDNPMRPGQAGARSPAQHRAAHAGAAAPRGRRRRGGGAGVGRAARRHAGIRVSGADGRALGRGPLRHVGRDRRHGPRVDHPGHEDKDEARPPGAVVRGWRWRSSTRRERSATPVRWCSPPGAAGRCRTSGYAGCSNAAASPACRMASARRSGDWAAEETNHPREVIEAALAHIVQNRVEAAHARSDLFERRRRLMHDWAAYLVDAHRRQPPIAEPAEQGIAGRAAP